MRNLQSRFGRSIQVYAKVIFMQKYQPVFFILLNLKRGTKKLQTANLLVSESGITNAA